MQKEKKNSNHTANIQFGKEILKSERFGRNVAIRMHFVIVVQTMIVPSFHCGNYKWTF